MRKMAERVHKKISTDAGCQGTLPLTYHSNNIIWIVYGVIQALCWPGVQYHAVGSMHRYSTLQNQGSCVVLNDQSTSYKTVSIEGGVQRAKGPGWRTSLACSSSFLHSSTDYPYKKPQSYPSRQLVVGLKIDSVSSEWWGVFYWGHGVDCTQRPEGEYRWIAQKPWRYSVVVQVDSLQKT